MADKIVRPGKRITLGADKAYDRKDFVKTVRALGVTPHVAQNNKSRRRPTTGRVLGRGIAGCIAVCLRIPGRALQLPCASSQDSVVRKLLIDRWPHE